jgi:hypothetical protein
MALVVLHVITTCDPPGTVTLTPEAKADRPRRPRPEGVREFTLKMLSSWVISVLPSQHARHESALPGSSLELDVLYAASRMPERRVPACLPARLHAGAMHPPLSPRRPASSTQSQHSRHLQPQR